MFQRCTRRGFAAIKPYFLRFDNNKPNNLVVCHGLMGSHKNFRNICRNPLVTNHVNCYLLDARNHGDSPHTQTHSAPQLAEDLAEFIKQQKLKRVTLMGHSMGGLGVIAFSKLYASMQDIVDNLIIIDISNSIGAVGKENKDLLAALNKISLKGKAINEIYHELDGLPVSKDIIGLLKTNIQPSKSDPTEHEWKSNIRTLYKHYDDIVNFMVTSPTDWKNPVDIIYGGNSNYVNSTNVEDFKRIYTELGSENIHRIEDAGHWLHFEKPKEFLGTLDAIFKREGK